MPKFHFIPIWLASRILCAWMIAQTILLVQIRAQTAGSVVDGVVRDTGNHPMAGVKVSLDDQVEGRTLAEVTDSAGHFRFSGLAASTYLLFTRKPAYVERMEGPFALGRGETKALSLVMTAEKDAPPGKNTPQVLAYSDEPQFTVAGVTDPSNVGGHGSNATLPTKEALAKETASLATEGPVGGNRAAASGKEVDLPKVDAGDFAQNLEAGKKLLVAGKGEEAVAYLEQAARLQPEDFEAGRLLATAYVRGGDARRGEKAIAALQARRDTAELHALLGEAKEAEGQPVEAVKEYARAAEMEPSEENLFAWGAELLLHHADAPAAEVFAKGRRLHPKSVRMLIGAGAAAYARDLNEEAAQWLLAAIALQPADPRPYLFLGKVQEVAKSEPPEWVEAFRKYAALQPSDARAHYYYAVALAKQRRGQQDFGERDAELQRAIAIEPRMGDAYLKLGLLQEEKGELEKAVASLQKAVEFTPLPDEAHLRLAQVYRRMGETEKARSESALYEEISEKKKAKLERERRELGELVIRGKGGPPPPGKP